MSQQERMNKAAEVLKKHARTAVLADLVPSGDTSKKVSIKNLENPEEIIEVTIKRIDMDDLGYIERFAKDNPVQTVIGTVFKGLIDPVLKIPEIKSMHPPTCNEICMEILRFSGLLDEEIQAAKNSPEPVKDSEFGT